MPVAAALLAGAGPANAKDKKEKAGAWAKHEVCRLYHSRIRKN